MAPTRAATVFDGRCFDPEAMRLAASPASGSNASTQALEEC
jgi:hypothetical protein